MKKTYTILVTSIFLTACSLPIADNPQVGMHFDTKSIADKTESGKKTDNRYNFYKYLGQLKDVTYYEAKQPYGSSSKNFNGAVGIKNKKIISVIPPTGVVNLIKKIEANAHLPENKPIVPYSAEVRKCISRNFSFPHPPHQKGKELFSKVRLNLTKNGEIISVLFLRSSGNRGYDSALNSALMRCNPLPKPTSSGVFPSYIDLNYESRRNDDDDY